MTILFIDDDPEDTELFCEAVFYLKKSDFLAEKKEHVKCLALNNGCKTIEFLSDQKELPNYIFLDINMPMMDGKECLIYLKNHPKFSEIPVIMLSTALKGNQSTEFKSLGAYDCIQKPTGFKELVKVLSKYIYE